tara:strand:+ start:91 stop:1125 length:1035 start_codon:yes stop_codon:yes gene_type:complete
MGSLSGDVLTVLDPATGKITDGGRESFIADTQDIIENGPGSEAGMLGISGTSVVFNITALSGVETPDEIGASLADAFGRDTLDEHMEDFETWHNLIVDGIYVDLATQFDITSDYPILPIFDPTFIIPIIIEKIKLELDLDIDIDIDIDLVLSLAWVTCMAEGMPHEDCEVFLCMVESIGDNSTLREKFEKEQDDGTTLCDIFPITIDFPPEFVLPTLPELPSFAIPGIGLPSYDLSIPPEIPGIPAFFVGINLAVAPWLIDLVASFAIDWMELLPCIPCLIEWIIEKIIELIMMVLEAIAGYISFIASMIVIIKQMVVWVAVDLIVAILGPGMIAKQVASLLGA